MREKLTIAIRFLGVVFAAVIFLESGAMCDSAPTTPPPPDDTTRNVFIVVIDGARYSETYDLQDSNMPRLWNDLRPEGTIFMNFRNDGPTITCPGHAAFLTGKYEPLRNDGTEFPHSPTLFEYFRSSTGLGDSSCYVVVGKNKLHVLAYSTDTAYGAPYRARFAASSTETDTATWRTLQQVMDNGHPRLVIVNFPSVDLAGHDADWPGYVRSIREADSLVYLLWSKIQSDPVYKDRTTLFVSSDHGRHDDAHGGFQHHGDGCEGCRRIIGFGIGPGFAKGAVVDDSVRQIDVRAAAAKILSVPIPPDSARQVLTEWP